MNYFAISILGMNEIFFASTFLHVGSQNALLLFAFKINSGRKAMFVSNHNSWMDIPFLGYAIGWHNYKFVAKKELEKVPILGKAIKVAENVLVDRSDRKSQLLTLKQGIKWLDVSTNTKPMIFVQSSSIASIVQLISFVMRVQNCRMVSTYAHSQRAHAPDPVDSCPSKTVPSKWHIRPVHPSFPSPSVVRPMSCHRIGCFLIVVPGVVHAR